MHLENLSAKDTEGTYLGKPGDRAFHIYLAYAGDTQVELVQHVSGKSMFDDALEQRGDSVQHVAYWLDDSEYHAAAEQMESAGEAAIQGLELPLARVGYFDTQPVIGVVTESEGCKLLGHYEARSSRESSGRRRTIGEDAEHGILGSGRGKDVTHGGGPTAPTEGPNNLVPKNL